MLYTKACPRCSGDVKLDRDNYGVYAKCLQCGFNRDFMTRRDNQSPEIGGGLPFGPERVAAEAPNLGELGELGEQREAA